MTASSMASSSNPKSQIPALFLSHSGAQKDFTRRLYRELIHVNHNPFFDQDARDSLPRGEPFPPHIVEACRACKLGIVVVSHEYIESLWPMLELHQLLFCNPSSPNNVYPVFYRLKPADLSKQENLARWQSAWERQAPSWHAKVQNLHMVASSTSTSHIQPMLDISSWPKALDMLRYQSGDILPDNKDVHVFIQTIVRNICNRLPPPNSFLMADHFKGAEHIQQEIHKLFRQEERIDDPRRMPIAVGVYGVGGSGKTTVCKYMLNFYNKEYLGRCCFLQFPSREEGESHLLVTSMKEVLEKCGNYTKESLDKINNVEQAMPHLQELLTRYKVFLVLDNVWDWALPIAKQIVTMHYMLGSKLLVTARSERMLETLGGHINEGVGRLLAIQIVHVPSISEEEAVEALMAYSLTSWQYATNVEDLHGLARSCFFDKQCHPLLLKAMGAKLRHLGGHTQNAQEWTQLISRLQARGIRDDEEIEHTVVNVLKTSFDGLHSAKLKDTFLHLGTCIPSQRCDYLQTSSEWLSMLSHSGSQTIEDVRDKLVELEYHGLIQIYNGKIVIHDLQMMLIENIVRERDGAPKYFFFEGNVGTLSASERTRLRYIDGFYEQASDLTALGKQRRQGLICGYSTFDQRATSSIWPNIEVLCLQHQSSETSKDFQRRTYNDSNWLTVTKSLILQSLFLNGKRLSVKYMQSLRYLELFCIPNLKELGGWHGAPNLVSVKLFWCGNLQKIENVACLRKLESLAIQRCGQCVTNFSRCENLKRLVIDGNDHLKHLASLGHLPELQELSLEECRNVVDVGTLFSAFPSLQSCNLGSTRIFELPEFNCKTLQSMEELDLRNCSNLKRIPDLKQLLNLRRLDLKGCHALKEVKVGDGALTSLEDLSIQYRSCHLISMSCSSSSPIHAWTNLRRHWADGDEWDSGKIFVGSNLPVSLEHLTLDNFETAEEIAGLSALVNLKYFEVRRWPSLTKITGLGSLTKLEYLRIWMCGSLRDVGYWEAPFISNLERVSIWDCGKLETVSTMRHLPSLKHVLISSCPMLQMETVPQAFWENGY